VTGIACYLAGWYALLMIMWGMILVRRRLLLCWLSLGYVGLRTTLR